MTRSFFSPGWSQWMSLAIVALLLGSCGGAREAPGASEHPVPPRIDGLPWPPPEATRAASDDIAVMNGSDASPTGGHAIVSNTQLILNNSGGLAWGIYSMGGFSGSAGAGYVRVAFSAVPAAAQSAYVAVANYALGRWEWQEAIAPEALVNLDDLSKYISPNGGLHAALVQNGKATVTVEQVTIARLGLLPPAPQNLAATPDGFGLQLSWDAVPYASGYNLYRSDHASMQPKTKLNSSPLAGTSLGDQSVIALQTYYYAVTALRGDESPRSAALQAAAPAENLPAPANLQATADVGVAHLTWDAVTDALTYRIYRSLKPDFSNPEQVQAAPALPQYNDTGLVWDKVYYYKVSAVRNTEGQLSALVDIHVPAADLPAPANLRVQSLAGDTVDIAWDYNIPDSFSGFKIYFSTTPDFNLDGPFYHYKQIDDPSVRDYSLSNLMPLTKLYVRVAAFNAVGRGRATDDINFETNPGWTFGPGETIGTGSGEMSALGLPGKVALAYFNSAAVQFALRDGGVWSTEAVGMDSSDAVNGFSTYIDIAESGGKYCVCAFATAPRDLWAAIGAPGAWASQRIDGDGDTGHEEGSTWVPPVVSGVNCRLAAAGGEFGVIHATYLSGGDQLLFQSSPVASTAWSAAATIATGDLNPPFFSLSTDGSDFYALRLNNDSAGLLLGSLADAWNWQDVAGGIAGLGGENDLQHYDAGWLTPALDSISTTLQSLDGPDASAAWTARDIATGTEYGNVHMAVNGPQAMLIYMTQLSPSRWYYSVYDGNTWSGAAILLPGYNPSSSADVAYLDGTPYFIFADNASGNIIAAPASPPV